MTFIIQELRKAKQASFDLVLINEIKKNHLLLSLAQKLKENCSKILVANAKDLAKMDSSDPKYDRLALSMPRIYDIAADVEKVAKLDNPLGKIISEAIRPNGLNIKKIRVPLGLIAVIYESRPNVTIDVFSLCFKTGNTLVLKGGKEAENTNLCLVKIIYDVLEAHNINPNILKLMTIDRNLTLELLQQNNLIDVCIPRGSQELINFVRTNATIPIIETGAGIVHTYFDINGDLAKGTAIIENAKTRRVSVCNALDTLIIHNERLNDLPALVAPLALKNVELYADPLSYLQLKDYYPLKLLNIAKSEHFAHEFLSYKMAIKTVKSLGIAIDYINEATSHHSEAIITEDMQAAEAFLTQIDAAAVYVNCSTAFTDGGEFGLGAEIGISTQKLHARGPMGLEALTSYKWLIVGNGQIRAY